MYACMSAKDIMKERETNVGYHKFFKPGQAVSREIGRGHSSLENGVGTEMGCRRCVAKRQTGAKPRVSGEAQYTQGNNNNDQNNS